MSHPRYPGRIPWSGLSAALWLVALLLVAWTLAQLPLASIASEVGQLVWWHWVLWSLVNGAILYLAIWRWQVLGCAVQAGLSLSALFRLRQAGSAVSFLTPGPHFGGEPLQLYWLHRRFGQPLHCAVAMLGLDRFVETGVNLAVLLGGVLLLLGTATVPMGEWLQTLLVLAAVLCTMIGLALVVLKHPVWLADRFRQMMPGRGAEGPENGQPGLAAGWLALVDTLRQALWKKRPRLWLAMGLAGLGWVVLFVELVLLLRFLGLEAGLTELILIMVGMRLAMLLPVPGGLGTVEASVLWTFSLLGWPASGALALIALIRLRDALVLMVGLGCLWSFRRKHEASVA